MAHSIEKIEEDIRSLSVTEKLELLRSLIAELDAPADNDVERAWLEEAQRRHRELVEEKIRKRIQFRSVPPGLNGNEHHAIRLRNKGKTEAVQR